MQKDTSISKVKIPNDETWKPFNLDKDIVLQDYFDRIEMLGIASQLSMQDLARMQVTKFVDLNLGRIYSTWFLSLDTPPHSHAFRSATRCVLNHVFTSFQTGGVARDRNHVL